MAKKIGKSGTKHWIWQRVSAILLIPLSLWIIVAGNQYIFSDYSVAREWLSRPMINLLVLVSLLSLITHAHLGLVVIIDDYTNGVIKRVLSFVAVVITTIIGISAFFIFLTFSIK